MANSLWYSHIQANKTPCLHFCIAVPNSGTKATEAIRSRQIYFHAGVSLESISAPMHGRWLRHGKFLWKKKCDLKHLLAGARYYKRISGNCFTWRLNSPSWTTWNPTRNAIMENSSNCSVLAAMRTRNLLDINKYKSSMILYKLLDFALMEIFSVLWSNFVYVQSPAYQQSSIYPNLLSGIYVILVCNMLHVLFLFERHSECTNTGYKLRRAGYFKTNKFVFINKLDNYNLSSPSIFKGKRCNIVFLLRISNQCGSCSVWL